MTALEPILLRGETMFFLLNLIVAVSLASGAGLASALIFRRGSLPLRHGLLLSALAVVLLSPALVWLGQRTGSGLIQIAAGNRRVDGPQAAQLGPAPPSVDVVVGVPVGSPTAEAAVPPAVVESVDVVDASPGPAGGDVANEIESSQPSLPPAHVERVEVASLPLREAGGGSVAPPWWHVTGSFLVGIWMIGILVGLVVLGRGLMLVGRLRRSLEQSADARIQRLARKAARLLKLPKAPPVAVSPLAPVPLSLGLVRPVIVLPKRMDSRLDDESLEAMLIHESAHIARRDQWVGLAQRLAAIMFWWHPLIGRANRRLAELREELCDNYVVQAQGGGKRFAKVLVDMAEQTTLGRPLPAAVGLLETRLDGLTGRIARLLEKEPNLMTRLSLTSIAIVAIFSITLVGATLVSSVQAAEGPEEIKNKLRIKELEIQVLNLKADQLEGDGKNEEAIELRRQAKEKQDDFERWSKVARALEVNEKQIAELREELEALRRAQAGVPRKYIYNLRRTPAAVQQAHQRGQHKALTTAQAELLKQLEALDRAQARVQQAQLGGQRKALLSAQAELRYQLEELRRAQAALQKAQLQAQREAAATALPEFGEAESIQLDRPIRRGKTIVWQREIMAEFVVDGKKVLGKMFIGPNSKGGFNAYLVNPQLQPWRDAYEVAADMSFPGFGDAVLGSNLKGHLLTLQGKQEAEFIETIRGETHTWLGLTDNNDEFGRLGTYEAGRSFHRPYPPLKPNSRELRQPPGPDHRGAGWAWITGEPFEYQAWGVGYPNEINPDGRGQEDAACFFGSGGWNDVNSRFDYKTIQSIIEWDLNLPERPKAGDQAIAPRAPAPPQAALAPAPEAAGLRQFVASLMTPLAAVQKAKSLNNLKMITIAMLNYEAAFRGLPAAYNTDKEGKPLLSWRVHVLPFIEQQALYAQFHLDEPWDSEHNRKLIRLMPAVYHSPGSKSEPGRTNYLGVGGERGVMVGPKGDDRGRKQPLGTRLVEIIDGASNTIVVVEASDELAVVWSKPDDFDPDQEDPIKGLVGLRPGTFLAMMCDGSAHAFPAKSNKMELRALFTRDGREGLPARPGFSNVPRQPAAIDGPVGATNLPGQIVIGPNSKGGFNAYLVNRRGLSWRAAYEQAAKMSFPGYGGVVPAKDDLKGHLVTFQGAEEADFIGSILGRGYTWIGLTDNKEDFGSLGAYDAGRTNRFPKPPLKPGSNVLRQPPGPSQRGAGWVWVTGEPLEFQAWANTAPDELKQFGNGPEDAANIDESGLWHDVNSRRDYTNNESIVEWELNLPKHPNGDAAGRALQSARQAAYHSQARNRLKQIALGLLNHEATHRSFPAAYNTDEDGKPLLSWRVHVLPFIGQSALYAKFHLDEPWNSEHNRKLIRLMPTVYQSPGSQSEPGKTNYLGVGGPRGVLVPPQEADAAALPPPGIRLVDMIDGPAGTVGVVEASDELAVVWTKPGDFEPDDKDPVKGLVGVRRGVFLATFCDGSVRDIAAAIDKATLRAMLTRDDGNVIGLPAAQPLDPAVNLLNLPRGVRGR